MLKILTGKLTALKGGKLQLDTHRVHFGFVDGHKLMAKIQFEVLIPEPSNAFIIRRQKQRVIYDEKEKKK